MFLEVKDLKLHIDEPDTEFINLISKKIKLQPQNIKEFRILRKSIDARKKYIYFVYNVFVEIPGMKNYKKYINNKDVLEYKEFEYVLEGHGEEKLDNRPIIIGSGPAGLFAALTLAQRGYKPIILERGLDVDSRTKDVEALMDRGEFSPRSNIQFGEGGAGSFSDGKLTTRIKDPRIRLVLDSFVRFGAPEEILYEYKPHIGTDVLKNVIKNMRKHIESLGGEFRFNHLVDEILVKEDRAIGVHVEDIGDICSNAIIGAIGHSARDTYKMLFHKGLSMESKPFAIGVRVEHLQEMIDKAQYGEYAGHPKLGAADYMLTHRSQATGRSVYSFCMCPGGYVVPAASEADRLVTNGMSYHDRAGQNANSAIVVTIYPEDFGDNHPLSGISFQRYWEEKAYSLGGGGYRAPVQLIGDFLEDRPSNNFGAVKPTYKPGVKLAQLKECLPDYVTKALKDAIIGFEKKIKGFAQPEGILTAIETRTSSPLRLLRGNTMESLNLKNFYPAGEGAGYAGGIVSSAVDGIKVAEEIIKRYKPLN
jgi:uncharacterized FAD-dependent dehydrogenase